VVDLVAVREPDELAAQPRVETIDRLEERRRGRLGAHDVTVDIELGLRLRGLVARRVG
jgi:hypothetical protein